MNLTEIPNIEEVAQYYCEKERQADFHFNNKNFRVVESLDAHNEGIVSSLIIILGLAKASGKTRVEVKSELKRITNEK